MDLHADSGQDGTEHPLPYRAAGALLGAISDVSLGAELDEVDPDLPRIGAYHIDRRLGAGGSGVVYHAVRPGWSEEYAIKLLHRPVGDGLTARRALRELDVVERLRLPSLPRVFDYDVHADGRLFIVSEYVDGLPLDQHCTAHDLDRHARVQLLVRVARVLHQLHQHGVIHRDVKPGNVLVGPDGEPRLIDLGIAALITDDPLETWSDDQGPVGSPAFMAPEQARGEPAASAIPVDLYGLGATACYLLTGQTPHLRGATLFESIRRVATTAPRRARELDPDLPAPLAAVLDRAIAGRPEDRFHSAAALADDLERWVEGRPVRSQPPSWWRNRWLSIRRHPRRWGLGRGGRAGPDRRGRGGRRPAGHAHPGAARPPGCPGGQAGGDRREPQPRGGWPVGVRRADGVAQGQATDRRPGHSRCLCAGRPHRSGGPGCPTARSAAGRDGPARARGALLGPDARHDARGPHGPDRPCDLPSRTGPHGRGSSYH